MTATTTRAGDDLLRDTSRTIPAAVAFLAAVVVFFVAERTAAAAWHHPAYNYAADWVSDLGVPGKAVMFKGHLIHSPRAWVLDAGFILNGGLVSLGALLVLRTRAEDRLARWHRRLLVGYGVGLASAGILHESPSWSLPFHAIGATLAIGGGAVATLLTGRLGERLGIAPWLARVFEVLGAIGITFFLVNQVVATIDSTLPDYIGTLERLAGYPVLAAQLLAGLALLAESAGLRRRDLVLGR